MRKVILMAALGTLVSINAMDTSNYIVDHKNVDTNGHYFARGEIEKESLGKEKTKGVDSYELWGQERTGLRAVVGMQSDPKREDWGYEAYVFIGKYTYENGPKDGQGRDKDVEAMGGGVGFNVKSKKYIDRVRFTAGAEFEFDTCYTEGEEIQISNDSSSLDTFLDEDRGFREHEGHFIAEEKDDAVGLNFRVQTGVEIEISESLSVTAGVFAGADRKEQKVYVLGRDETPLNYKTSQPVKGASMGFKFSF